MVKVHSANLNLRVNSESKAQWEAVAQAEKRTLTNLIEFVMDNYVRSKQRKEARIARDSK
jgi:hypothetical protein